VITEQRLGLARLLEELSDDEWEQPSLCAGWRVRDVAAHVSLVALPPSPGSVLVDLLRARGNFHQLNTMASRRRAERAPNQLISDLRQHAGSRKIPIVSDQRNVLFDLLVHVQDMQSRSALTCRCLSFPQLPERPAFGRWDGHSGHGADSAGCGCAPPATGPPAPGQNCRDRYECFCCY
jgi:hypothetical protein